MEFLYLLCAIPIVAGLWRLSLIFTDPEKYRELAERDRERRRKAVSFGAKMAGAYVKHRFK